MDADKPFAQLGVESSPVKALRFLALAVVASVAACSEEDDLKDTRPGDSGDLSVTEVAFVDSTLESGDDTGEGTTDGTSSDSVVTADSTAGDSSATTDSGPAVDTGPVVDTGPAVDTGSVIDSGAAADSAVDGSVGADSGPATDSAVAIDSAFDATLVDSGTVVDTAFDSGSDTELDTLIDSGSDTEDSASDTLLDSGSDTSVDDVGTDTSDALDSAVDETGPADVAAEIASAMLPKPSFLTIPARSHTIALDGLNDFAADERFATTTSGEHAFVTWDAEYLYVGYEKLALDESLNIYLSTGAPGANASVQFGPQRVLFAFSADRAVVVRGETASFLQWSAQSWSKIPVKIDVARKGEFVELRISFSSLGVGPHLGLATFVSGDTMRGALFASSWMDGYSEAGAPKTVAHYLDADRSVATPPAAMTRRR